MLSLDARHADRAQRKADNAAFSTDDATGHISHAANLIANANEVISGLSSADKDKLKDVLKSGGIGDGFADSDTYQGYDEDTGQLKAAGIGVVDTRIIPAGVAPATSEPAGWGAKPDPATTPADGNQNGAAIPATDPAQASADAETAEQSADTTKAAAAASGKPAAAAK